MPPRKNNTTHEYRLYPLGEAAWVVEFGQAIGQEIYARVQAFSHALEQQPFAGMVELIPAFTTVTVYYDPKKVETNGTSLPFQAVEQLLKERLQATPEKRELPVPQVVKIPVCYGGEQGPDLEVVARHCELSAEEVIRLHTERDYLVYMIGFAPGFPYLGGMNEKLTTPRKETPRASIPAGSVGIAGAQTGIYPLETPGGWQLIGRTPVSLFRPQLARPSLLQAGDVVRFYAISESEFHQWEEEAHES